MSTLLTNFQLNSLQQGGDKHSFNARWNIFHIMIKTLMTDGRLLNKFIAELAFCMINISWNPLVQGILAEKHRENITLVLK